MSFFKSIFGSGDKPKPPPAPTVNDAIQKQKLALEQIDKKLLLLHHKFEQETDKAKTLIKGKKGRQDPRLISILKRKKQYEGQIDTLEQQRFNLDSQMNSLDTIEMNKIMINAVKAGNEAARNEMETMNPDAVGDIIDDMQDLHDDAEEISTMLAEPLGAHAGLDEDELLDDFLNEMELEDEHEITEPAIREPVLPNVSDVNPMPAAPVSAAPVAAGVDEEEDEFARLEAEMAL